jgi:hypothetical protein
MTVAASIAWCIVVVRSDQPRRVIPMPSFDEALKFSRAHGEGYYVHPIK